MRRSYGIFLFILCVATTSSAQWVQTNGPGGGTVTMIVSNQSSIFAATQERGLYRSADDGVTWNWIGAGLPDAKTNSLSALAANDNALEVAYSLSGAAQGVVYRSTDNGASWQNNTPGFTGAYAAVYSLAAIGNDFYAGTSDSIPVVRSTDNGATWTSAGGGLPAFGTPSKLFGKNTMLFALSGGLYRSTDNGGSWIQSTGTGLTAPYGVSDVALLGDTLYAATIPQIYQYAGFYKSTDYGDSWTLVGSTFDVKSIVASAYTMFICSPYPVGLLGGVFRTADGISRTAAAGFPSGCIVNPLLVRGSTVLAGTDGPGMYRSTDSGSSFIGSSAGLTSNSINFLFSDGSEFIAASKACGTQLSPDNGASWTQATDYAALPLQYFYKGSNCIVKKGDTLYAGTNGYIERSIDGGSTWSQIAVSPIGVTTLLNIGNYLFAQTGSDSISRTSDNGATWTSASSTLTGVTSIASQGTSLYAGTSLGVFRSTDNGGTWTAINTGIVIHPIYGLATSTVYASPTVLLAGTFEGLHRSTDDGASWTRIDSTLLPLSYAASGSTIVIGDMVGVFSAIYGGITYAGGVHVSTDGGATWRINNTGFPNDGLKIKSFAIQGGKIYAGTDGASMWTRSLGELMDVKIAAHGSSVPSEFFLSQNYPNPFNPTTTIDFTLPADGKVTLKVYDVLGREVAVLLNNEQRKAGELQQAVFDASRLSSGVYFSRLAFNGKQLLKKMLLLK